MRAIDFSLKFAMESTCRPSGHLSLIGLVVGYALFGGVGYLVAGWWGAGCGVTLLTVLFARQLWWTVAQSERRVVGGPDTEPAATPGSAPDAGP